MKFNRELGLLALSKEKKTVVFCFHTEAFTFDFFYPFVPLEPTVL